METATRRGVRPETVLLIIALLCAVLLAVMVVLCLPYFGQEAQPSQLASQPTEPSQAETTGEPAQEPTEAPPHVIVEPPFPGYAEGGDFRRRIPDRNPYGPNDFQFDENNYLYCTSGKSVSGIDVSAYQGDIDWKKVKASGIEFAIIRVAFRGYESGKLVEDSYARQNLVNARAAGLEVGVYIFSQAVSVEEAAEEAEFLLDIIKDYEITMPVVFDWEQVGVDTARTEDMDRWTLTDCSLEFCRIVEEAGYTPMVYFNRSQAKYLTDLSQLRQYDFWLAAYTDRMEYGYKLRMWQYTNKGRVDGIEGDVDINVWFEY